MSLLDNMMESCIIINKSKISDGEGGIKTEWTEGAEIMCAVVRDSSMQAMIAEKQGVTSVFTITTKRGIVLEFHDIIKRKKDGMYLRITSEPNDVVSPDVSTLDIRQVSAERWELSD